LRQNIGLILLVAGSILLSYGVFRTYLDKLINYNEWKNVPLEIRMFLWLFCIKNRGDYLERLEVSRHPLPSGRKKELSWSQRIYLDVPIIAFILMIIGFFLSFSYSALWRFLCSIY
jgi:hypothetical protein